MISDTLLTATVITGLEALDKVEIPTSFGHQDVIKLSFQILSIVILILKLFVHRTTVVVSAPVGASAPAETTDVFTLNK